VPTILVRLRWVACGGIQWQDDVDEVRATSGLALNPELTPETARHFQWPSRVDGPLLTSEVTWSSCYRISCTERKGLMSR